MVEVERKLQPRRKDRRRYVEDEYDVRRQEKHTPIFIENILRGFDCVTERLKEFVEKENKKRESKEERESEEKEKESDEVPR